MDQDDLEAIKNQSILLGRILDTKYKKSDLDQQVNEITYLTKFQRVILLSCLKFYEDIFDGNIGEFNGPPVQIPLKGQIQALPCARFPHSGHPYKIF